MKHLLHILLVAALLTLLAGGCRRSPGEAERRLIAIDSLIAAHPDSALTLLAEVDTAALGEPDRAYHALLTVQAMYKAGISIDDSTLICRAQRYYANHGPADRQIRTMSYRASVAEDLGDTEDAMRWYKRTELAAREHHDDFNTGYALMSMGVLYQLALQDKLSKQKYQSALNYLKKSPNVEYQLFCLLQVAQFCSKDNPDSCLLLADSLMNLAKACNNTPYIYYAIGVKACCHFYKHEYRKCIELSTKVIDSEIEFTTNRYYYFTSISYSKLGIADSANIYYNSSPGPILLIDTIHAIEAQAALCELRHDYKRSQVLYNQATDMSEKPIQKAIDSKLKEIEDSVVAQKEIEDASSISNHWPMVLFCLLIAGCLAAGIVAFVSIHNRRRRYRELEEFKIFNDGLNDQLLAITSERDRLSLELEKQLSKQRNQREFLNKLETELATLRQQSEEEKQLNVSFTEIITLLNASLANLQAENDALSTELSRISGLELEKSALSSKLAMAQASVNELTQQLKGSLADSKVQKEVKERLAMEVEQMQAELENAEQQQVNIVRQLKLRDEQNQLQAMQIEQLHIMLRDIFNEYEKVFRKAKNKSADSFTRQALNSEFLNHIQTFVNQSYHGLVDAMRQNNDISEKEINVICMHLCHIPNAIISQYTGTKEHSVINMKSIAARKFFGEKGKCEDFTNY